MEFSLEVTVWFIISLIFGIILFSFVINVDYNSISNNIRELFIGEKESSVVSGKSINETILISLEIWRECGFGEINLSKTIYINESGNLNNSIYFNLIKELNLCHIISNGSNSCGGKLYNELKIINNSISTPKIIQIRCNPISKKLELE